MTVSPDFGGREIEEGLAEDLGAPPPEHAVDHRKARLRWDDNEAHAGGMVCALCGAAYGRPGCAAPGRRRMVHDVCSWPGTWWARPCCRRR